MNGWNEDNFLEEMMHMLGRVPPADPCPDAEAFRAVADGEGGELLKNSTAEHAARCPACRELQQRLQAFDAPILTGQESEWEQTEKRLDNWMENFLASGAAVHRKGDRIGASYPHLWWKRLTKPIAGRQMRWVLVPVATAAVAICSFLVGRITAPRPPQLTASTSYGRPFPNPKPAGTVANGEIPEPRPDRDAQLSQAAPQTQPNPVGESAIASSRPKRLGPPVVSNVAPHDGAGAMDTAVLKAAAPRNSEVAQVSSPLEPPQNPPERPAAVAPVSPPVRSDRAVETAETFGTPPLLARSRPGALSSGRAMTSGMRSIAAAPEVAPAPAARAAHASAIPVAPAIRLDAGTRVWITVQSVHRRADGVSEFRGVLLLPVTQANAVLIDRNTEVLGTMTAKNGKKSVRILGFLSNGARYKLRSASGEANLRPLGAGEAVEFNAGKVVETWMASGSTYEKLSAEPKPPE
ncbi:MAG: hypothetical protein ABSG25_10705 [Bryobacteraceae bacterium]